MEVNRSPKMSSTFKSRDAQLAWQIHHQLNRPDVTGITENAAFPDSSLKENYKPKTLIDNTLEIIDPTPNIHTLFVQFDKRFFSNKLITVEVKWSHRMTSCAGTCSFNTGNRYCVIALSSPLLKLRPRKDLIETLLHEMIHAYLFITNNNRDRDGHGPEFCKHMTRINKEAGTNITIYHTFHAEVKLYQQHWWRCNGPCQKKHPFFGMVRRAMNRAPGPNDFWWKEHQLTCGGQFIKVREPEKTGTAKNKKAKNETKNPSIGKWLVPSPDKKPKGKSGSKDLYKPKHKPESGTNNSNRPGSNNPSKLGGSGLRTKGGSSVLTVNKWNTNVISNDPGIQKLGNATNNVHGFGTAGPRSSGASSSKPSTSSGKHFSFSGTLGGLSTGQSRLVQIFGTIKSDPQPPPNKNGQGLGPTIQCPICKDLILEKIANEHIDSCLIHEEKKKKTPFVSSTPRFVPGDNGKGKVPNGKDAIKCPVCNEPIFSSSIMEHVDLCLTLHDAPKSSSAAKEFFSPTISVQSPASSSSSLTLIEKTPQIPIVINDSDSEVETPTKKHKIDDFFTFKGSKIPKSDHKIANCPVCEKEIQVDDMNRHLDDCLTAIGDTMDRNEAGPSTKRKRNERGNRGEKENQNEKEDQATKPETCLICNEVLNLEIPLIQHLDDCLRNMFDDYSDTSFEIIPKKDKSAHSPKSKIAIPMDSVDLLVFDESEEGESDLGKNNPKSKTAAPMKWVDLLESDESEEGESDLGKNDPKSKTSTPVKSVVLLESDESDDGEIGLGKNEASSEPSNKFPCPICMSLIPEKDMNNHLDVCIG